RRVGGAPLPTTPPRRRCNPPRTHAHPPASPECHRPRDRPSWTPYAAPPLPPARDSRGAAAPAHTAPAAPCCRVDARSHRPRPRAPPPPRSTAYAPPSAPPPFPAPPLDPRRTARAPATPPTP